MPRSFFEQVAKPHTGSTLLNAILQGFFDEEDASYAFLPKRPPGQDDLRFGPYPPGVEEAGVADITLPFIVHEGKLKLSRDHLSDTIVTKTHVIDIDLIEETFGRHFQHIYYVVANRAEKDILIDEKYCSYSKVLCVDYDDFAYSPDSSSSEEILEKVQQIKKNLQNKFAFLEDYDLGVERTLDRVKKMEEATEMMASKTCECACDVVLSTVYRHAHACIYHFIFILSVFVAHRCGIFPFHHFSR